MEPRNELDHYWKLKTYTIIRRSSVHGLVVELGYDNVNSTRPQAELINILDRHERGQVVYDQFPDQKLVDLADGTGYEEKVKRNWSLPYAKRLRLIEALQKADTRGSSFERFLELPAELRAKVYECYVLSLPQTLRTPLSPPFSRVCSLIRRELLPIFYGTREFEIRYNVTNTRPPRICEESRALRFLVHLTPEDIICIRWLQLSFARMDVGWIGAQFTYRIDLGDPGDDFTIHYVGHSKVDQQLNSHLKHEMFTVLSGHSLEGGKKRFKLQDIYNLRGAIERAFDAAREIVRDWATLRERCD